MVKTIKKVFLCTIILCLVLTLYIGVGENKAKAATAVFETLSYDVQLNVDENKKIRVKEVIKVNFKERSHGLFRYIPIAGNVYVPDENNLTQAVKYKAHINGIKSNKKTDVSTISNANGKFKMIRLGDADIYEYGVVEYEINYNIMIPDIEEIDFSVFYFNIFPTEWETAINNASFNITYPKNYQNDNLQFLLGNNIANEGLIINKTENGINGTLTNVDLSEGFSIVHKLENGFFKVDKTATYLTIGAIVIGILIILAVVFLWLKFGKDEKTFVSIEVREPKNMTPSEAGYLVDGLADTKDMIALFFYWANNGYILIKELSKENFEFTKLKELENAKNYEKTLFNAMFKSGDVATLEGLSGVYYKAINDSKVQLETAMESKQETKIYDKSSVKAQRISCLLAVIPIAMACIILNVISFGSFLNGLIFTIVPAIIFFGILSFINATDKIKISIRLLISYGALLIFLVIGILFNDKVATLATIGMVIISGIIVFFALIMKKKTSENVKIRGQLLGLREYINKVEKEQLEKYIKEDPKYYYNILPFAYVLGVSDVWAKNFEGIAIEPPDWYVASNGRIFTNLIFYTHLNRCLYRMNSYHSIDYNKAISQKMDSLGGGSGKSGGFGGGFGGGGGFSGGGGFGGGGGGSW